VNIEQEVLIVVIEAMKKYEILYNSSPSVYENKDKRMATWHFVIFVRLRRISRCDLIQSHS